jgi:hypothetical protein
MAEETNLEGLRPPEPLSYVPPRWLTETYDNMHVDMAEDLFAALYHAKRRALEKTDTIESANVAYIDARLVADAIMDASIRADTVGEAAQRAFFHLVYIVNKHGLHQQNGHEYETLQEWLGDRIVRLSSTSGEVSDIAFINQQLFPILERMPDGWRPADLLKLKENWTKTRAAVPFLRKITSDYHNSAADLEQAIESDKSKIVRLKQTKAYIDPTSPGYKEARDEVDSLEMSIEVCEDRKVDVLQRAAADWKKNFEETLNLIADPNVHQDGPMGIRGKLAQLYNPDIEIFKGLKAILPGRTMFLAIVDQSYERAVESALSTIMTFDITDPDVLVYEAKSAYQKAMRKK